MPSPPTLFNNEGDIPELSKPKEDTLQDTLEGKDTDLVFCEIGYVNVKVDYESAEKDYTVLTVTSPEGTKVSVFNSCVDGTCHCKYAISGCELQLKPCRFARYVVGNADSWGAKYSSMLWSITDGYKIIQGEVPRYSCRNYNSILEGNSKGQMNLIVRKEIAEGMISETTVQPHCIHALGAVPKLGGKIRPITDCSRPEGQSVNNYCGDLLREFTFKSVDDVVSMLEPGDFMTVIDIKAAYRAVPLFGEHRKYMGFVWELDGTQKTFLDNRMCFGLRLGPSYFAEISEFIHDVLVNEFGMRIVNYLDDFIAISSSFEKCFECQSIILNLLRFLGFHVSYEKVTPPSTCTTYLGIEVDSMEMVLRLPENKLVKLNELLVNHLKREKISKFDLESLGGLLAHCSHVVRGGKIFCKRIYSLYKELLRKNRKSIRLPSDVKADIRWWSSFCRCFNGVAKINNILHVSPMVSDSSFKGFGVYLGEDWLAGMWEASDFWALNTKCNHIISGLPQEVEGMTPNINVYELWPIVLGLKRWAPILRDRSVLVFTDNTQVMYMLSSGKSSNVTCMAWLREIFWICIIHNIEIWPRYINTNCNLVADTLSRIPYFKSGKELANKIGGSSLCCSEMLFDGYRLPGTKSEEEGSRVP